MKDFIDAADDLRRNPPQHLSLDAFEKVFNVLRPRLERLHSKSVVDLDNIESIFGFVEMGRLVRRLPDTPPSEIESLAAALRTVLGETVTQTCRFTRVGAAWQPHEEYLALAESLNAPKHRGSVAFVSFNYDIALDFALHWTSTAIDYGLSDERQTGVPLLKLHGSLNWIACPSCGFVRPISLQAIFSNQGRPVNAAQTKRPVLIRPKMAGLAEHCPGSVLSPDPAIVPPSWNKTRYWESFAAVWRRAVTEIAEAESVVTIGYSMPPTDSFFRELLALGLVGPTRIRQFVVVDPDPGVQGRFRELLGPETQKRFRGYQQTFSAFVDNAFRGPQAAQDSW